MANQSTQKRLAFSFAGITSGICAIGLLLFFTSFTIRTDGDSIYGKITEVKSPTQMQFSYDSGSYNIRLVGLIIPDKSRVASTKFVKELVLQTNCRIRLEGRTKDNELLVRLYTDDPDKGIKEVAIELLRAGLAQRDKNFDFKYGEMESAQLEARRAKLGIWNTQK
ncbi:MAG: thermonuclease family protein [Bacteroidetes bacterium]|nr:thermonuclease family protein [Bacteroidota bacterium]